MRSLSRRWFLRSAGSLCGGALALARLSAAIQTTSSPYRRPKLKITDVRTAEVRVHGHQLHVRIYTDQGIYGHGEATDAAAGAASIIQRHLRFVLLGQDPLNIELLFERGRTLGIFAGAQAGQYVTALTAVEIALWDLAGKALELPIYQLLGGKVRDRIRLYCDTGHHEVDNEKSREILARARQMGFSIIKMDCDDPRNPYRWDRLNWTMNNRELDLVVKRVEWVRQQLPQEIELAVDGHGRFDVVTAKRLARAFEPLRLLYFEEPVPAENVAAMREVRESTATPIACGENRYLRHGFTDILEQRAADILTPDFQKCGGLFEGRKIADLAHAYYTPIMPHCVVSPIGTMASCHVCATIPNFVSLEWHWFDDLESWREWVQEGDIIKNGFIEVSDRPGIGLTMNEEAARKRQVPGTPWFEPWKG